MDSRFRWFECYAEVAPPSGANGAAPVYTVPEDWQLGDCHPSIFNISFPTSLNLIQGQVTKYTFRALWKGTEIFGHCRHACGEASVILARKNDSERFYRLLEEVAEVKKTRSPNARMKLIRGYLLILSGLPQLPRPLLMPKLSTHMLEYIKLVDTEMMLQVMAALLHERRIIIKSAGLHRLAACVQSANDLIYPLMWQHIVIPILPESLLEDLTAPTPYLIGVPDTLCQNLIWRNMRNVVVVDIDSKVLTTPFNDLQAMPERPLSALRSSLTGRNLIGNAVPRAFHTFMVHVLDHRKDTLSDGSGFPFPRLLRRSMTGVVLRQNDPISDNSSLPETSYRIWDESPPSMIKYRLSAVGDTNCCLWDQSPPSTIDWAVDSLVAGDQSDDGSPGPRQLDF